MVCAGKLLVLPIKDPCPFYLLVSAPSKSQNQPLRSPTLLIGKAETVIPAQGDCADLLRYCRQPSRPEVRLVEENGLRSYLLLLLLLLLLFAVALHQI